ncbi:putative acid phosphatase DIA3 [Cyphellophora attinorum]|uniref:Putative acid phosphatase DIA3 n=1 Tax=Cyphellophora attinorum TaxID=1664694 RepID=A0A0N1H414_9EURO|nr:putative acid phosphatase DIA3 [Phialophora attinorum]KPI35304.1 putative acid phosphatase DIA3 [Phialophora attinorum]
MSVVSALTLGLFAASTNAFPASKQAPLFPQDHTQNYNFGLRHGAPDGCKVTSASYLVRHGAIYANDDEYEEYIKPVLWKLEKHRGGFTGSMEFLNDWHSPILEDHLEDITPSGKEDAKKVGQHLLQLYPDLVPTTKRILADKKPRTYDTAAAMMQAFPKPEEIEIVRITQDVNGSMDSLIPHKACPKFNKKPGKKQMETFLDLYGKKAARRLAKDTAFELKPEDILGLQSICGYQSAIEGKRSPLCGLFTDEEWMSYEYAWDLRYAYMVGPLNPLSPYLGFPWLESQLELLDDIRSESAVRKGWPKDQNFFLSFTHREVPPFVATALGIFNSSSSEIEEFPTDRINWVRAWKMSDLIPFLGHVGMEKITCGGDGSAGAMEGNFIRFVANTAPRPIPQCQSGPGASCPFDEFKYIIEQGAKKYSDFHGVCGPSPKSAEEEL